MFTYIYILTFIIGDTLKHFLAFLILILLHSTSTSVLASEFKVVVRAHHGVKTAIRQWQSTIDELNNKMSPHKFSLIPIRSLDLITQGAGSGDVDFVLTNPSSFVEIQELYDAKPLVTLNNKRDNSAHSRFGSVLFSKSSNTSISRLSDIKGKSLMAVSKNAFGGWRVAWIELLDNGIDPYKDLKKVTFVIGKTQPEVVWSIYYGKADVGVVRTDLLEGMIAKGDIKPNDFRILNQKDIKDFPLMLSTKLYPEWAFSVLKHVPKDITAKVKSTLLGIKKNQKAAIAGKYIGWVQPRSYKSVQELMKRLKVGPYK